MKTFILLLLLVSCTSVNLMKPLSYETGDFNSFIKSNESFKDCALATYWIYENIKYSSDMDLYNQEVYWATPSETLKYRKGDCADKAVLLMYCLKMNNIKSEFISVNVPNRGEHAIVKVYQNDTIYYCDPTFGDVFFDLPYKITFQLKYEDL